MQKLGAIWTFSPKNYGFVFWPVWWLPDLLLHRGWSSFLCSVCWKHLKATVLATWGKGQQFGKCNRQIKILGRNGLWKEILREISLWETPTYTRISGRLHTYPGLDTYSGKKKKTWEKPKDFTSGWLLCSMQVGSEGSDRVVNSPATYNLKKCHNTEQICKGWESIFFSLRPQTFKEISVKSDH